MSSSCICAVYRDLTTGEPRFLGLPVGVQLAYEAEERARCPRHGQRCFVAGCTAPLWVTCSWREGPTYHACREHVGLLRRSAQQIRRYTRQGVLL